MGYFIVWFVEGMWRNSRLAIELLFIALAIIFYVLLVLPVKGIIKLVQIIKE